MDQIVFGEYTVQDLLFAGAVVVGLFLLTSVLAKMFGKKSDGEHNQRARCSACGWTGTVSKFAGRCPKCSQELGQRKARPLPKGR